MQGVETLKEGVEKKTALLKKWGDAENSHFWDDMAESVDGGMYRRHESSSHESQMEKSEAFEADSEYLECEPSLNMDMRDLNVNKMVKMKRSKRPKNKKEEEQRNESRKERERLSKSLEEPSLSSLEPRDSRVSQSVRLENGIMTSESGKMFSSRPSDLSENKLTPSERAENLRSSLKELYIELKTDKESERLDFSTEKEAKVDKSSSATAFILGGAKNRKDQESDNKTSNNMKDRSGKVKLGRSMSAKSLRSSSSKASSNMTKDSERKSTSRTKGSGSSRFIDTGIYISMSYLLSKVLACLFIFLPLSVPLQFVGLSFTFVAVFLLHLIIFGVGLPAYLSNHNPFSREHIFCRF